MSQVNFIKLGGSLITDKTRPETVRDEVLSRLAREVAGLAEELPGDLVLGHGSGSFGHAAAERFGVGGALNGKRAMKGVAVTQDRAATLHRRVCRALLAAGARPYSVVPSSWMVAKAGEPAAVQAEPLMLALDRGLLPVVYGDVVMDRVNGASICSTETVFEALVDALRQAGRTVDRAVWLGLTDGVLDEHGETLAEVFVGDAAAALQAAGSAVGVDVTGGMRHRLESALRLAERGVTSRIVDGREPGLLSSVLSGGGGGTRVRSV